MTWTAGHDLYMECECGGRLSAATAGPADRTNLVNTFNAYHAVCRALATSRADEPGATPDVEEAMPDVEEAHAARLNATIDD